MTLDAEENLCKYIIRRSPSRIHNWWKPGQKMSCHRDLFSYHWAASANDSLVSETSIATANVFGITTWNCGRLMVKQSITQQSGTNLCCCQLAVKGESYVIGILPHGASLLWWICKKYRFISDCPKRAKLTWSIHFAFGGFSAWLTRIFHWIQPFVEKKIWIYNCVLTIRVYGITKIPDNASLSFNI